MNASSAADSVPAVDQVASSGTAPQHHPYRWRLHRLGIANVWYYYDNTFDLAGGRGVLRGTNGSGKSRALEMLLPFLLDGDRRKMDATGSGKVSLQQLMRFGSEDAQNRVGYLWLELARTIEPDDAGPAAVQAHEYLTVGAFVRFSRSTGEARVLFFDTPLRVGVDLPLIGPDRQPLSKDKLIEAVGADRTTDSAEAHRDRIRTAVFGLTGEFGRERYAGLLQLLHTLRSPDVGNKIDDNRLPAILSEALPPLSEQALTAAGEKLDALSETRAAQRRLEESHRNVSAFLDVYRRYGVGVITAAADNARQHAGLTRRAASKAARSREEHDKLVGAQMSVDAQLAALETHRIELDGTIAGIKQSKEYDDLRDLDEREQAVAARGQSADTALGAAAAARDVEGAAVQRADERAQEVVATAETANHALAVAREQVSAAGSTGTLPQPVTADVVTHPGAIDIVRTHRDAEATQCQRPAPARVHLVPADLDEPAAQTQRVAEAADQRALAARSRRVTAQELDRQEREVDKAQTHADQAAEQAAAADQAADEAAASRDQSASDLVQEWLDWVASPATSNLLGEVDWRAAGLGVVLDSPESLAGVNTDGGALAGLRHVAQNAGQAPHAALATSLATLELADGAALQAQAVLEEERAQLRADVDVDPPALPWLKPGPAAGTPLWRAVDFASHLSEPEKAGLEAALLSSGLLLATISTDGSLRAQDGQLLLQPRTSATASPLSEALVVDAASPVPSNAVDAVLAAVALEDRTQQTWVARDGSWANGPLSGRLSGTSARYVGAAARAAARKERLEQIRTELEQLAADRDERGRRREEILRQREELNAHLRFAPSGESLAISRVRAAEAQTRSVAAADRAREAALVANQIRQAWVEALTAHHDVCRHHALPFEADALGDVVAAAESAAQRCRDAAERLETVGRAASAHHLALERAEDSGHARADSESAAQQLWASWHAEQTQLVALRENVGVAAEKLRAELREAEDQFEQCRVDHAKAASESKELIRNVALAESARDVAEQDAAAQEVSLRERLRSLEQVVELPGLAAAATGGKELAVAVEAIRPSSVEAAAAGVVADLDRRGGEADESALHRARQALERAVTTFDVIPTVVNGVQLVEVIDASGRNTIAGAEQDLRLRLAEGRAALTETERDVFTQFVLGGVAEELRRRLGQAEELIAAMNASLASIRTTHGIGVKLRWQLVEGGDSEVAQIRELVTTSGAVRSGDATASLTALLKSRVTAAEEADSTLGYTEHLRATLDYRAWHEVEVIILGPAPGQERKITRRAKLSQGETRFVSYIALFAAVDAYLTGLPDPKALRLLLLDDAFAKVDDRTIAELMGLLVRLDVDFVMTGHALWGCYPQVPSLDCYEVRRHEGTAAVTTHVHWDGRNRHLATV